MMARQALTIFVRQLREMDGWYFQWPSFRGDFKRHKTVDSKSAIDGLAGFFGSGILMAHRAPAKGATEGHGVFIKALLAFFREAS